MTLLSAPINLPAFYFFFTGLAMLCFFRYRSEFIKFVVTDRLFTGLLALNTALLVLPLEFSSQALKVWGKFLFIFLIPPLIRFLIPRLQIDYLATYLIGSVCASFIYILEKTIPIVPKLSYGDVSAAGIVGFLFILCISHHIQKQRLVYIYLLMFVVALKYLAVLSVAFAGLATLIVYCLCLCGILFTVNKSTGYGAILSSIHLYALLSLDKRGPILGTLISMLALLPKASNRTLPALLLGLFAIGVLMIPTVKSRFSELVSLEKILSDPRTEMWKTGISIALEKPFGVGYGRADILREVMSEKFSSFKHFHSNYVNILVENGFLGFVLFTGFLAYSVLQASGLTKMLAVYLIVTGLFESNYVDSEFMINFFIVLGISLALSQKEDERYSDESKIL